MRWGIEDIYLFAANISKPRPGKINKLQKNTTQIFKA